MFNSLFDDHRHARWHHRHGAGRGHHGGRWRARGARGSGGAGWFGDFFGPPPRADRGGVRYLVLDAIASQARHGYEIMDAIEQRSDGAYRPSPGVVYPTLQLLEELGHARTEDKDGRKVYAITEAGSQDLEAHREEVDDFYERLADDAWERRAEDIGDLFTRIARLMKTFRRAMRRGQLSSTAKARIYGVLDDATARIEAIVAENERPTTRKDEP